VGVGLVTATLVSLSPHLVWYSQEAKMYALLLALGLLSLYAFRRAVDVAPASSGVTWWGVTVGATTLALYSHVLLALLIPLLFVLGLIWWPHTRRHWRRALVAFGFLTLPYLPLLAWQARNWFMSPGQATLFTVDRLDVMLQTTLEGWGGNFIGEPWATVVLGSLSLLALFGLFRSWLTPAVGDGSALGRREPDAKGWRELLGLLAWMLLPLLGIWLISARQPIFTNRYLIWAAPAFYALAAVGYVALLRFGRAGGFLAIGLLLFIIVGDGRSVLYQDRHPIKPDFQSVATHLETRYRFGDLIVFHLSSMEDNFDYYFDPLYSGWGAPAPGGEMSDADLDLYMRSAINGHETVWLVLSESQMWDPQGRVKAWMDAVAVAPPEERAFAHVSVYRYRLPAPTLRKFDSYGG
jgi:4-amino-4-deoxy-L-arabinose transferase-like glycosyltransferase